MKKALLLGLMAAAWGLVSCTKSDNIINGCMPDASDGQTCNLDAGSAGDVDTDTDADTDQADKPYCENLFRPKWECARVLGCLGPRDLNMNVLADTLHALDLPHTRFRCPPTLPVCCVRDYFPERDVDGGMDGGPDGG